MPVLVEPALSAGTLRDLLQPSLTVDEELRLRPWGVGDAAVVQVAFGCEQIQRWHVRRLDDLDEAVEWTAQWETRWAAEEAVSWAVVDGHDQPLGQVGLRSISLAEGSAGLSYWVLPAARGRRIAARSVQAVCRWAFDEIGFNRLDIQHSVGNHGSCKVAGQSGFSLEGTLRRAIKHADGWHDWHVHGRVRGDRV